MRDSPSSVLPDTTIGSANSNILNETPPSTLFRSETSQFSNSATFGFSPAIIDTFDTVGFSLASVRYLYAITNPPADAGWTLSLPIIVEYGSSFCIIELTLCISDQISATSTFG